MNTIRNAFPEEIEAMKPLLEMAYGRILAYQLDPTNKNLTKMQDAIAAILPTLALFKPYVPPYKRRYIEVLESGILTEGNDIVSCFDRAIYEMHARVRGGEWGHLPWSENLREILDGRQKLPDAPTNSIKPTTPSFLTSGKGMSRGVVTGTARVILGGKRDFDRIERGDILVCRMSDPDFVIVVDKIAGLITDHGGELCHAAILARTWNIPCIVGTTNATEVIRDGQNIQLDAYEGIVSEPNVT
jgi:phosphohistidine swiveling domain-containing protein